MMQQASEFTSGLTMFYEATWELFFFYFMTEFED